MKMRKGILREKWGKVKSVDLQRCDRIEKTADITSVLGDGTDLPCSGTDGKIGSTDF